MMTANSEPTTPNVTTKTAPVGATKRTSRPAPGLRSRARHSANEPDKQPTRTQQLLALLGRRQGTTTAEMLVLTGWQAHSLRAALSGLRKQGHVLERDHDRTGQLRYRLVKPVPLADAADC